MLHAKTVTPATLELLNEICSIKELKEFNLAGGTALALQIGHRISYDLDFFGRRNFETTEILDLISRSRTTKILSQSKNILILTIDGIKVDFVNYKYPLVSNTIEEGKIRILSVDDIAAMKLAAIAGRGRKRDFYDLYFI
jgi:predicted nucleotidyltransferase component of viral defense system